MPSGTMPVIGINAGETPLRWLADNVNSDYSCMMTDMDFTQSLEQPVGHVSDETSIDLDTFKDARSL